MISSKHHITMISPSRTLPHPSPNQTPSPIPHSVSDPDLYSSMSSVEGKEAISLAYIEKSMVVHKYRGQGEKETDIYEVLQSRMFSGI